MKLHQVQLLSRVPIILKDLYDADLLEEDVIFAWAEKVGVRGGIHVHTLNIKQQSLSNI